MSAFHTLIILTGETERPVLAARLAAMDPGVRVIAPDGLADLPGGLAEDLGGARLLTFIHPEIVPASVLGRLGYGAYNIHPGPPGYPGWAPAAFALHEGAEVFGATLHEMAVRVDAGPICDVESFAIPPGCSRQGLEELAYAAGLRLLDRWAESLVSPLRPPRLPLRWGAVKGTRKRLAELERELPPLT